MKNPIAENSLDQFKTNSGLTPAFGGEKKIKIMKKFTAEVEIDYKDGKVAIEMASKENYELEDCEIGKVIILNLCNGETYTGIFKGMDGDDVMIGSLSGKNIIGLSTSVVESYLEQINL